MIFISPNSLEIVILNFLFKEGKPWNKASFGGCFDTSYDSVHREILSSVLFQMCYWKCYYTHNFEIDVLFWEFFGGEQIPNFIAEFLTNGTRC